ncbi:dihydropteroate synthase [Porticoccaceae bacterium]|nr:dihydropteroate synthase [Porticoccaceae bacterium]MDA8682509.1 dihydropteroate synthase [Porticoccaceae bacterium]MDB2343459.1 dihydropteroate synthase [Porticoccaceae bacterium]MDB2634542.1 dihydropteroate synthase [Porticoccaceae bacterium]MDB2664015.1 dihydropteroate synthase [Porticoccaceae bacterium]
MPFSQLSCGTNVLDLSRPNIMGILNVTPDSFSDGGKLYSSERVDLSKTLAAVEAMLNEGADIIDIGGESTRPGAAEVSVQEELDRVIPVLEAVTTRFETIVSVDTSTAEVISEAARNRAGMLNDVRALRRDGALQAAASTDLPVCLMHMQNQPKTMQAAPVYDDVVKDVLDFLADRTDVCEMAGIRRDRILIDPGFGFGKTLAHNLQLFKAIDQFVASGHPVLVGVSRKSMIGQMLGIDAPDQRVIGSVALAMLAAQRGAAILRVHDVKETKQALDAWSITIKEQ